MHLAFGDWALPLGDQRLAIGYFRLKRVLQLATELFASLHQPKSSNLGDLRQCHRAANRMAEKRARVNGFTRGRRPGCVHQVGAPHASGQRKSTGERFAEANEVGHGLCVLARKPFSRAAHAGENFVNDQEHARLVADAAQHRQKFPRRNVDAAAALNWFDENGPDLFSLKQTANRIFQFAQLSGIGWKRNEIPELTELRTKRQTKMFAMRGVKRAVAEAVIAAGESNDTRLARGEQSGLERRLDRLKPGIAENGLPRFRISDFGLRIFPA